MPNTLSSSSSINNFNIHHNGRYYAGSDYSHGTVHYHLNDYSLHRRIFHNHGQYVENNSGEVNSYESKTQKMNGNGPECIRPSPRDANGPPYPPISKIPPLTLKGGLHDDRTTRFHPLRPSPSPEINLPAIPKSVSNLEEEFRTVSPNVLEYVRNLERMVGKQSEDECRTAWPVAPKKRETPQRRRGLGVEYPAPSTSHSTPTAHTNPDDITSDCEAQYISDSPTSRLIRSKVATGPRKQKNVVPIESYGGLTIYGASGAVLCVAQLQ